ncbi:hypothetical protein IAQ61_012007 [Plenodomus lingam]|uniref:uncharacterized protein n=1 Tax=Leptosphaeria maculans TaxID=5022 RepID=UPI0033312E75|nr:hypothetical protein IAQ61_012007 [Plenodomus lingam]
MNQQWAAKAQETAYAESLDTTALQTPIAAPSRPIHSTPSSHCVNSWPRRNTGLKQSVSQQWDVERNTYTGPWHQTGRAELPMG